MKVNIIIINKSIIAISIYKMLEAYDLYSEPFNYNHLQATYNYFNVLSP